MSYHEWRDVPSYGRIHSKNHDHHVIWQAFETLEKNGMIAHTKSRSRGRRPESIYEIKEKGLELLISEDPRPKIFWNIILLYCYHTECEISLDRVKRLYKRFIDKYLKYSDNQWYTFELEIFNRASDDWIFRINSHDEIPLNQIILETLALHPKVTFQQLKKLVKAEDDKIRERLVDLTTMRYAPAMVDNSYVSGPKDLEKNGNYYQAN